jgi:pimeloyl-ACP methyl ester carboxylesterase
MKKKLNNGHFFTSFDSTKIFYKIGGANTRQTTILFLHGLGGNMQAWNAQLSFFQSKGYQTIAFDLRGHGLSGRPKKVDDYALEKFAEDILTFLKIYPCKEVVLVGHCLGGMVVLKLASRMKSRLKAIIIVATSIEPFRSNRFFTKYAKFLHLLASLPLKSPLTIGQAKQISFEKFSGTGDFDLRRITSDIFYTTLQSYLATSSYVATLNDSDLLKKISCPTLIIHGAKDHIFPVADAMTLQQNISQSKLVILPTANHIIPINNQKELTHQIETYLGNLD